MNKATRQRRKSTKGNRETKQSSGIPVSKLARQYKLTSKELIAILKDQGIQVKNERSALDPDTIALVSNPN